MNGKSNINGSPAAAALSEEQEESKALPNKLGIGCGTGTVKYPERFPPYLSEYIEQDRRIFEEEMEDNILSIVRTQFPEIN